MAQGYHNRCAPRLRLNHDDYTVGWICSLPCEVAAAEAMFDSVHETLPKPKHDKNVYSLGSISDHNVVITTLPSGVYGTTSAANVALGMLTTFKAISVPLLVGIAGGVPVDDIRLGDVVISIPTAKTNAVVQYDYGKLMRTGELDRTGHLNKPTAELLAAVTLIRGRHDNMPSLVPSIMQKALHNRVLQEEYKHPGKDNDNLWNFGCEHATADMECLDGCRPTLVKREPRASDHPVMHYGPIASGNQVIKNGRIRDKLAGVLVIRGISDYCDSLKQDLFQKYAALSAAAFAKELLAVIPRTSNKSLFESEIEPRLDVRIEELNFSEAQGRMLTVKDHHPATLQWLLHHDTYLTWMDHSRIMDYHGFLWIKGKPGTGKSTLMKFLLLHSKSFCSTIAFFFSGRGVELQRTTLGMYRSLLFQLLHHSKSLRHSMSLLMLSSPKFNDLATIRGLFQAATMYLDEPVICFIDALDESIEDEVRDLMGDLETVLSSNTSGFFRVCCSSRYYPHISVAIGLEMRLDRETNHAEDIEKYIDSKLRIRNTQSSLEIKTLLIKKAAGIFLWVVLVVQMLQRLQDHGRRHEMRKKLEETPSELHDLFEDMLLRDNEHREDLVVCLQWVLYARRPLELGEFYHAVLCMSYTQSPSKLDPEEITDHDIEEFIISCSKGLLEKTSESLIQVIHETVREYLLDGRLVNIWDGFAAVAADLSHSRIARCCWQYLVMWDDPTPADINYSRSARRRWQYLVTLEDPIDTVSAISVKQDTMSVPQTSWPLISYVLDEIMAHTELAERYCMDQSELLLEMSKSKLLWRLSCRIPRGVLRSQIVLGHDLMSVLVCYNAPILLHRWFSLGEDNRISFRSREMEINYARDCGYVDVLKILLEPAPSQSIDVVSYGMAVDKFVNNREELSNNSSGLHLLLLDCEEWVACQDPVWLTALFLDWVRYELKIDENRHQTAVGVPASAQQLLEVAVERGVLHIISKLLSFKMSPWQRTWDEVFRQKITDLSKKLMDAETRDEFGLTLLQRAALRRQSDVVQTLISHGADVNASFPPQWKEKQIRIVRSRIRDLMDDRKDAQIWALPRQ